MSDLPPITFWLVLADGRQQALVPGQRYVLGRSPDVDIVLHDALASRRHCELSFEPGTFWWVEDLGSSNGMTVNSRPLSGRQQMMDGVQLQIGGQILTYLLLPPGADPGVMEHARAEAANASTLRPSSEFGDIETMDATFTGMIEPGTVMELLQFLVMTGKTGRLDLFVPRRGMTWVYVHHGQFLDAGCDDQRGWRALQLFPALPRCRFAFFSGSTPEWEPTITESANAVLMNLARHADESAHHRSP